MKLRRCPSCRGYTEDLHTPRCFACGGELPREAVEVPMKFPSRALQAGKKDKGISSALLAVFAVFGGLGSLSFVSQPDLPAVLRIGLTLLLLAAAVLGVLSLSGLKNPVVESLGRPALKLFAFFGVLVVGGLMLLVGLAILLFVTCMVGGGLGGGAFR